MKILGKYLTRLRDSKLLGFCLANTRGSSETKTFLSEFSPLLTLVAGEAVVHDEDGRSSDRQEPFSFVDRGFRVIAVPAELQGAGDCIFCLLAGHIKHPPTSLRIASEQTVPILFHFFLNFTILLFLIVL